MKSLKEGIFILVVPLIIGLIIIISSTSGFNKPDFPEYAQFELTVWADTLQDSSLWGIPIVHVSDREATKASLVLLKNEKEAIPFSSLKNRRFHSITIGARIPNFEKYLNYYTAVSTQQIQHVEELKANDYSIYQTIIIALNKTDLNSYTVKNFIQEVSKYAEVIVVNFGPIKALKPLKELPVLLQAPNNHRITQELAAQLLFGGIPAIRDVTDEIAAELGLKSAYMTEVTRLGYADPEYVGISSDSLAKIDEIVRQAIDSFAIPGCQVLIAKEGKVIFQKAFGYHTYEKQQPVKLTDLYDLASITKIASTTLASMRLYEEDKINLDEPLNRYFKDPTYIPGPRRVFDTIPRADYLAFLDTVKMDSAIVEIPEIDTIPFRDSMYLVGRYVLPTQKKMMSEVFDLKLRDLLTHTSGLQASLPIIPYKKYVSSPLYSQESDQVYSVPVANRFYMRENYLDSLWNITKGLHIRNDSNKYEYSCVNMILMQRVIDSINQASISDFVSETFYKELGLQTMSYNPLEVFGAEKIVPTASDRWRGQLLCGTVHDPTAALMGGVSGNAGLFSNANDLAILGQMLLNKGKYGGVEYFEDSTVNYFTSRRRGHRGLGFDKPPKHSLYLIGESASLASFGHTGFTGTCIWVDPEQDLVYIFLSNRIHPNEGNFKINELRVRQRIHQVVYDALNVPHRESEHEKRRRLNPPMDLIANRE